jgi:hypothetical protein
MEINPVKTFRNDHQLKASPFECFATFQLTQNYNPIPHFTRLSLSKIGSGYCHPNEHAFAALQAPNRGESLTNFHPKFFAFTTHSCYNENSKAK